MYKKIILLLTLAVSGSAQAGLDALCAGAVVHKICKQAPQYMVKTIKFPWLWYKNGYLADYAEAGDYKNVKKVLLDGWDPEEGNYRALQCAVSGALKKLKKQKNATQITNLVTDYTKTIDELIKVGSLVSADWHLVMIEATTDSRLNEIAQKLFMAACKQNKKARSAMLEDAKKWKCAGEKLKRFVLSQAAE